MVILTNIPVQISVLIPTLIYIPYIYLYSLPLPHFHLQPIFITIPTLISVLSLSSSHCIPYLHPHSHLDLPPHLHIHLPPHSHPVSHHHPYPYSILILIPILTSSSCLSLHHPHRHLHNHLYLISTLIQIVISSYLSLSLSLLNPHDHPHPHPSPHLHNSLPSIDTGDHKCFMFHSS